MLDCSQLSYLQMAELVRAIHEEVKKRNPPLVNWYVRGLIAAEQDLEELHPDDNEQ